MSAIVFVDGRPVEPPDAPAIPVLDRGFLYGDSAFEVLRTYGKRPFTLAEHLARLRASCVKLGIPLEPSDEDLGEEIALAIAESPAPEVYVRVIVTRGVTAIGLDPGKDLEPRRVIVVLPLPPQAPESYSRGVSIATVALHRALDGTPAAGAKASNYLANIISLGRAMERGAYEAISVGPAGELIEGTTSNLFVVHGSSLWTPPISLGLLAGITRSIVLELARGMGLVSGERLLYAPHLYRADEAFITSTLREVMPVALADGVPIGKGVPGPVSLRLLDAFRARARSLSS